MVDEVIRIKGYEHRAGWYDLETLFDSRNMASPATGRGAKSGVAISNKTSVTTERIPSRATNLCSLSMIVTLF